MKTFNKGVNVTGIHILQLLLDISRQELSKK